MYVTDTHPLVYAGLNALAKLGVHARQVFAKARLGKGLVYVPTIALWEIALLNKHNKLILPEPLDRWCRNLQGSRGFSIEPLDWMDVEEARKLPFADPVDCLIVGTALRLQLPLITKDQAIVESGLVEAVW